MTDMGSKYQILVMLLAYPLLEYIESFKDIQYHRVEEKPTKTTKPFITITILVLPFAKSQN
jgi:hypothetical protein